MRRPTRVSAFLVKFARDPVASGSMPAVRDELERRHARGLITLVSVGMAVSGVALTVGAVSSRLILRRGSMRASVFVAITVLFVTVAAGCLAWPIIMRIFSGLQPRVTAMRHASIQVGRSQKVREE
jgi:hypothetical protein